MRYIFFWGVIFIFWGCNDQKPTNTKNLQEPVSIDSSLYFSKLKLDDNFKIKKVVISDSQYVNCHTDGITGTTCVIKQDLEDGIWIAYEDRKLQVPKQLATIQNHKFNGLYCEVASNGIITRKGNYKNGEQDGAIVDYSDKGTITQRAEYAGGKQIGKFQRFNEDGKIVIEQIRDAKGKLNVQVEYKEDKIWQINYYTNCGYTFLEFFDNGNVKKQVVNNTPNSPLKKIINTWDSRGNLVKADTTK